MSAETLFYLCTFAVLPGWLLLAVAPHWPWTARLITFSVIPGVLASVYLYLMLAYFYDAKGGFGSLAEVAQLFQNPHILLAGWIHYLAFDLFIGSWQVRDAQRLGVSHGFVLPCLILTFLFGPVGLGLYMMVRWTFKQKMGVD